MIRKKLSFIAIVSIIAILAIRPKPSVRPMPARLPNNHRQEFNLITEAGVALV